MAAEMEVDGVGGSRNPDIYELFCLYNDLYFHGALGACIVDFSSELNDYTGICHYYERGCCEILLSESLLKVRSIADLKNALLHEMIHAFLWIESGNKKHSDHGTNFQEKVNEINSSSVVDHQRPQAGYNITVHHDFKKEVNAYRFYQWICDTCGHQVKKTTKPSASDCNQKVGHERSCSNPTCEWHKHQNTCSGTYCRESPRQKEKNLHLEDEQELQDRKPESPRQKEKNLNLKDEQELQNRKPESSRQKEKNLKLKGEQELQNKKPETLPYLTRHGMKRLHQTEGSKGIADGKTTTTTEKYAATSSDAKKTRHNNSSDDDDYLKEFNPKETKANDMKTENHAIAQQNPKGVKTHASKRKNRCTGMKRNCESKKELIAGKWREWVKAYKAPGKWFKVYGDEEEYEDIEPLKNKRSERRKWKKVLESTRPSFHVSDDTGSEEQKEECKTPEHAEDGSGCAPSQLDIDQVAQSPSIIILD